MPACAAASEKVAQSSVTSLAGTRPGSTRELPREIVTDPPKRSLPVNDRRISAPASLKLLWPEEYSAKGGVGKLVGWYGNQASPAIVCVPLPGPAQAVIALPWKSQRIAVIGRTESNAALLSQAQQPASKIAFVSAKKSLTAWSRSCSRDRVRPRCATCCANRFQCPGGSSECGPSAQYSAIIFCSSVSPALRSSSSWACSRNSGVPKRTGPVVERSS